MLRIAACISGEKDCVAPPDWGASVGVTEEAASVLNGAAGVSDSPPVGIVGGAGAPGCATSVGVCEVLDESESELFREDTEGSFPPTGVAAVVLWGCKKVRSDCILGT